LVDEGLQVIYVILTIILTVFLDQIWSLDV